MILRARHLQEDRLLDCYLAEQSGEPIDPPAAEHLADCAECAHRYADLARFMDGVRVEADAEVDELFPPEWQRAQHDHIRRRIEHLGHPARVISFPGHPSTHHMPGRSSRWVPRWIAGAAAAGLFLGVYIESFVDSGRRAPQTSNTQMARSIPPMRVAQPALLRAEPESSAAVEAVPVVDDAYDQFLQELELAGDRPHTPELVALDELTPHVRPIRLR